MIALYFKQLTLFNALNHRISAQDKNRKIISRITWTSAGSVVSAVAVAMAASRIVSSSRQYSGQQVRAHPIVCRIHFPFISKAQFGWCFKLLACARWACRANSKLLLSSSSVPLKGTSNAMLSRERHTETAKTSRKRKESKKGRLNWMPWTSNLTS